MGTMFPSYDLDPDGRTLAVGHDDGTVTLTDARTLREIARVPAARKPISGLAFVPGSRTLVVGGQDALLAVDTGRGHRVTPLRGHAGARRSGRASAPTGAGCRRSSTRVT